MKAIASESDAQPRYCGWSQDLYATTSSEIVEALFGILRVSTCSSPSVCVFFFWEGSHSVSQPLEADCRAWMIEDDSSLGGCRSTECTCLSDAWQIHKRPLETCPFRGLYHATHVVVFALRQCDCKERNNVGFGTAENASQAAPNVYTSTCQVAHSFM